MSSPLHRRWLRPTVYGTATALAAGAFLVAAHPPAGGVETAIPSVPEVPQIAEPGVISSAVSAVSALAGGQVCSPGAKWVRLRFTELSLRGNDSVTLTGSRSGAYQLTAVNWPGKAFHTRAFEGDCVRVTPNLTDSASRYTIDAYQSGTQDLAAATSLVAAVGDLCGSSCDQTAAVVKNINPQALILAGDNAYNSGTAAEYRNNYHPNYGQFNSIVHPSPGNHEYNTSGASGYFDYFGAKAGERGKGYYSFDVGDWHFIALNSNISRGSTSEQVKWLKSDLAASTKPCTAAYWHHPRFSRGDHGDDTSVTPFWDALYAAKADLVVAGHDHNYQRFAPSKPDGTRDDANGVRELLIGTGGRGFYNFNQGSAAVQEAGNANTFGVAKLSLTASGYRHDFTPVSGRTYTDTVSGNCHKGSSLSVTPSSINLEPGSTASATVNVGGTGSTTLSVSGLPSGVTGSFSPSSVNAPGSSTLTLTASATAPRGSANATVTGTSGGVSRTAAVAVSVAGPAAFSDDFESDKGWVVNAAGSDTATTGRFERGDPEETKEADGSIKQLGTTPSGANCLVTGQLAGASDGANDVDGGVTTMTSPQFTVPAGGKLSFAYTFAHGDNSSTSDYFRVRVLDGSTYTKVFERLGTSGTRVAGGWQQASVDLAQFAGRTVRLVVEAADLSTASLWESAVDDVTVTG